MRIGTLYGVSVGTGDPELITVKGLRAIQQSPVIAFPSGTKNRSGIAQTIVSCWLQPEQLLVPLNFPYVQDSQVLETAWQEASKKVWHYLAQGLDVAFACLGDVSFYSTFTYLAQTLQELYPDVAIETIPGVCSPAAIASTLKIPLTIQQQKLVVLPALYSIKDLELVLDWAEAIVLLKVNSVYREVWHILRRRNLLQSSWIVEKATCPEEKIYRDLSNYPSLDLSYFSVLLIHNS